MDDAEMARAARAMVADARWMALATVADAGEPAMSYVPFAPVESGFGIVVSRLAAHTAHLTARPRAALLLVGEDAADGDPFARSRLSIDVVARAVTDPVAASTVWDALARRNGPTVEILRTLPDFRAFVFQPIRARIVLGFAQAGNLDGREIV
jgi:heme iron utilization protein